MPAWSWKHWLAIGLVAGVCVGVVVGLLVRPGGDEAPGPTVRVSLPVERVEYLTPGLLRQYAQRRGMRLVAEEPGFFAYERDRLFLRCLWVNSPRGQVVTEISLGNMHEEHGIAGQGPVLVAWGEICPMMVAKFSDAFDWMARSHVDYSPKTKLPGSVYQYLVAPNNKAVVTHSEIEP